MFDRVGEITLPPHSTEAKVINMALEFTHGRDVVRDKPKFRIVWSTIESEVRYGHYSVYYMEHIFLRDETGYLTVAKYPDAGDRWVLETFVYAPIAEVPESKNGHYEPLYVFRNSKGEYLPPLLDICHIIIKSLRANNIREIINELGRMDSKKLEKEIEYFKDVLEDELGSVLVTALRDREAVTVPRNYEHFKEHNLSGITKGEL